MPFPPGTLLGRYNIRFALGAGRMGEDAQLRQVVKEFSASQVKEAIDCLHKQRRVVEIADEGKRLIGIAGAYCKRPENTLVISPANQERGIINTLIHRQLQKEGRIN